MFGRDPVKAVSGFFAALNAGDAKALRRFLVADVCLVDSMGEELVGRDEVAGLFENTIAVGLELRFETTSLVRHGHLVLAQGKMSSRDPRFCGQLQMTLTMRRGRISKMEAFRGADAASLIRLYGNASPIAA